MVVTKNYFNTKKKTKIVLKNPKCNEYLTNILINNKNTYAVNNMKKIKDNIDKLKNNNFIKEILAINEHIYLVNAIYGVRDSQIQNIYFILFLLKKNE